MFIRKRFYLEMGHDFSNRINMNSVACAVLDGRKISNKASYGIEYHTVKRKGNVYKCPN